MVDWVITDMSNAMDKVVGYQNTLEALRQFVAAGGVAQPIPINIRHAAGLGGATTTLIMSNNNFTVMTINGQQINYNYANPLPQFDAADLPSAFPTGATPASQIQKTKLLYLLPEAARSEVIENAFVAAIQRGDSVQLSTYAPLVNSYGHTCASCGVNTNNPTRRLTAADYVGYANTLQLGTPDRDLILNVCS